MRVSGSSVLAKFITLFVKQFEKPGQVLQSTTRPNMALNRRRGYMADSLFSFQGRARLALRWAMLDMPAFVHTM